MKKKLSFSGIILIILFAIFEFYGVDLNKVLTDINNEKDIIKTSNIEEVQIEKIIDSELNIYFINVGQADCVLIQNNNENMLIDAGNNEDGDKIVKYLQSLGIKKFKYVIGTHPHEDHIGGLDNIINSFDIGELFMPDVYTTTKTFEEILDCLENKKMNFQVPKLGDKLMLGDSIIDILYSGTDTEDLNDASIVLKITFGSNSFLFTGDATSKVEKQILNRNIDADVYKVAHHGSNTSNNNKFLDRINPTYGIISCGKDNSYNHPHSEVIEALEKRNVKIYRTDQLGTILVTSNGKNINITNFKTDTNG